MIAEMVEEKLRNDPRLAALVDEALAEYRTMSQELQIDALLAELNGAAQ